MSGALGEEVQDDDFDGLTDKEKAFVRKETVFCVSDKVESRLLAGKSYDLVA